MLKYIILASILSKTDVDHLATNEAKIYSQDNEIIGMTSLKTAVEKDDIDTIQKLLGDKKLDIIGDPFIKTYLQDLMRTVRLKALLGVCAPYKSVKLDFLAMKMGVDVIEIRSLLSELILEDQLEGQIDQLNGMLELRAREGQAAQKHRSMQMWGDKLLEIHKQLMKKVQTKNNDMQDDYMMYAHMGRGMM